MLAYDLTNRDFNSVLQNAYIFLHWALSVEYFWPNVHPFHTRRTYSWLINNQFVPTSDKLSSMVYVLGLDKCILECCINLLMKT